ncbi:MAG TPA: ANTAR domain-containing protein [Acetivibrio clariflavus]|nr:ANTAR domain-containing protein [Acetivibrio clariflavus]
MDCIKFILVGEDNKLLANFKNTLCSNGMIYTGYTKEPGNILRLVRTHLPEYIVIDVGKNFAKLKHVLEIIDEEMLAACTLVLDIKSDEISDFLRNSRVMTYVTKPVFDEIINQIAELSILNFKRVWEYEQKVKKLNDTLESRKVIEKAKWILVQQKGLSEAEAYELIKKTSRDNRIPMKYIADAIILTRS